MSSQIQTSPSKVSAASPSKWSSTTPYKPFSHIGKAEEGKPWSTRVRISRKWNQLDFMGNNEVTSLDLFLIDENGDELHGVVPKKLIWKFDPLLRVGGIYSLNKFTILGEKKIFRPAHNEHRLFFNWDTEVKSLCSNSTDIPNHKFNFTHFEDLESNISNTYLTDVVGILISLTDAQQVKKKATKELSTMRNFTLQNLSGNNVKITLWGEAISELSRNIDTHGIKETPLIVVVSSTYVRKYEGKYVLSSTNATKVFFNLAVPEVLDMKERSCRTTPARQITLPEPKINSVIDLSMPDNSKTISELLESKWDPKDPIQNRITVTARATAVLTEVGWYYLGCNKCPTKVVGEEGNYGCTKCENKVEEPIPRYLLRFQVTDDSETTIFAALDSEVHRIVCASASAMLMLGEEEGKSKVVEAFDGLLNVDREYKITLTAFNNKKQTTPSFTVSRMPCPAIRAPSETPTPSSPVVATPKDESDTNAGDATPTHMNKTGRQEDQVTTPAHMNKTGRQEDQVTPSKRKKLDFSESNSTVLSGADE